jgi:hypothetical protein
MKRLSWDKQLDLASPLPRAAIQSGKTKILSTKKSGLDASTTLGSHGEEWRSVFA